MLSFLREVWELLRPRPRCEECGERLNPGKHYDYCTNVTCPIYDPFQGLR